ncbi:MAG: hypothetical protein JSV03_11930 [Planctomycetota bacterium]|nr:MAG: hypothetical protein JSV03_11930 [Planctomycetota bacterium]
MRAIMTTIKRKDNLHENRIPYQWPNIIRAIKVFPVVGFLMMLLATPVVVRAQNNAPKKTYQANVPIRAITRGPKSHWFSYYDKMQFDKTNRYVLGMEVNFDDRSPRPDDVINLGMVDLQDNDKWIKFAESRAWGWQQGCMLQWLPGSSSEVIYNDRQGDKFVAIIRDVFTGKSRVLPRPIYTISPDGKRALSLNFARVNETRPGYGYAGVKDPWSNDSQTENDGIYLIDLQSGESRLIITLGQIVKYRADKSMANYKHWFNHLLFNTDGSRFIFLHRGRRLGREVGEDDWFTRMFTARWDGSQIHCVADHGLVSHFIWRNPKQILTWSREPADGDHFHLYDDMTEKIQIMGKELFDRDGHIIFSPDGKWLLVDTARPDQQHIQKLMLYRPYDGKLVELGQFYLPPKQKGEWRCDLHGRWSSDGKSVCIDSMHMNYQRQMYLLDVSRVVK